MKVNQLMYTSKVSKTEMTGGEMLMYVRTEGEGKRDWGEGTGY